MRTTRAGKKGDVSSVCGKPGLVVAKGFSRDTYSYVEDAYPIEQ